MSLAHHWPNAYAGLRNARAIWAWSQPISPPRSGMSALRIWLAKSARRITRTTTWNSLSAISAIMDSTYIAWVHHSIKFLSRLSSANNVKRGESNKRIKWKSRQEKGWSISRKKSSRMKKKEWKNGLSRMKTCLMTRSTRNFSIS